MRISLIALITAITLSQVTEAATPAPVVSDDPGVTSAVKINVPFLALGALDVQYEHAIAPGASWALRGFVVAFPVGGLHYAGFGLGASYQWFPYKRSSMAGLFVSPGVDVTQVQIGDSSGLLLSPFALAGYNLVIANRAIIALSAGVEYNAAGDGDLETKGGLTMGLFPKGAITLGYGF